MDAPSSTPLAGDAPRDYRPPRFTGRLIVGLTIILFGVLFLLDALNVPGIGDVWHLVGRIWPIVFVLVGVAKLSCCRNVGAAIGASVWILFGGLLLANNFDLISFSAWNLIFPALVILVGVGIVTRTAGVRFVGRLGRLGRIPVQSAPRTSAFALWSGATRRMYSPDFQGGDATAIMGGCEIDLRQCNIVSGPAVLDVFALMGGIEVHVPGDWTVQNEGVAVLGAIEDTRKEMAGLPSKVLLVRGAAIMGGVEIKN